MTTEIGPVDLPLVNPSGRGAIAPRLYRIQRRIQREFMTADGANKHHDCAQANLSKPLIAEVFIHSPIVQSRVKINQID